MGIKSALIGAVVNKTIRTIATHGEVKDSIITKTNKKGNISPAYDFAVKSKKNCFIFEAGFFDICSLKEYCGKESLKYFDYDGTYKIFNKNGDLKFLFLEKRRGLGEELIGKDIDKLYLFDLDGNVLGRIREHIISLQMPVIENDSKTVSVFLKDNKLCNVRRYYSVGREIFDIGSNYAIEHIKNKEFNIKKGRKNIAKITIFRSNLKNYFPRSIVVEYDDVKTDKEIILLAMALDAICSY